MNKLMKCFERNFLLLKAKVTSTFFQCKLLKVHVVLHKCRKLLLKGIFKYSNEPLVICHKFQPPILMFFMLFSSSDDSDGANQRPRSRSVQDSPQLSPMRTLGAEYDLETQGSTRENRHSKNHSRFVTTASSASAPIKRPLGGFSVLMSSSSF